MMILGFLYGAACSHLSLLSSSLEPLDQALEPSPSIPRFPNSLWAFSSLLLQETFESHVTPFQFIKPFAWWRLLVDLSRAHSESTSLYIGVRLQRC